VAALVWYEWGIPALAHLLEVKAGVATHTFATVLDGIAAARQQRQAEPRQLWRTDPKVLGPAMRQARILQDMCQDPASYGVNIFSSPLGKCSPCAGREIPPGMHPPPPGAQQQQQQAAAAAPPWPRSAQQQQQQAAAAAPPWPPGVQQQAAVAGPPWPPGVQQQEQQAAAASRGPSTVQQTADDDPEAAAKAILQLAGACDAEVPTSLARLATAASSAPSWSLLPKVGQHGWLDTTLCGVSWQQPPPGYPPALADCSPRQQVSVPL
jgi:hypothetical protein